MQPQQFPTDRAKIAYIISLLSCRTLQWTCGQPVPVTCSLESFTNHFQEVFSQSVSSHSVHDQLDDLRQGRSTVAAYALQFWTLPAASGWNDATLITTYRQGITPSIRGQMAIYDDTMGMENHLVLDSDWPASHHLESGRTCAAPASYPI